MTHRPSSRVAHLLLLCLLAFAASVGPLAAQDTPSVDDVIARFVTAQGGEAALKKHDSQTWTGTFSIPAAGLSGVLTMKLMAPDFIHLKIEAPGLGTISEGYGNGVAWQDSLQSGPRVLSGAEAELRRISADYRGALAFKENFASVESQGAEDFADQACWKLLTVTELGTEMMHFFSQETGLLVGTRGVVPTEVGDILVTTKLSDWEERGGIVFALTTTQEMMGMSQILVLGDVTFGGLTAADFEMPPAIKAMVAATNNAD